MKVLHITRRYYPLIGGVEKYIGELAPRLIPYGIKSRVLTINRDIVDKNNHNLLPREEIIEGVEVNRIPAIGHYKKPIPLTSLSGLIEHFGWADIIHLHDVRFLFETSLLFRLLKGKKLVLSTHGLFFHTPSLSHLKKVLFSSYYLPVFHKYIEKIIAVSHQDYDLLCKYGLKNVVLIENGIDLSKYSKIARIPKTGKIVYFGRIDKNKGLNDLFNALGKLRNIKWHLTLIGAGGDRLILELKKLAQKNGISERINWLGYVPDKVLLSHLSEASLCVFPSTYEGFGYTLVEAMAAGCLCIANNNSAYARLIDNGLNGYLADFSDIETTSKLIAAILNASQQEWKGISQAATNKAKKYDLNNSVMKVVKIYKGCLN